MKEVYSFDIASAMEERAAIETIKTLLPHYQWRTGDSDAQGPYVSGLAPDGTNVKIWVGERPFEMSVSFSLMPKDVENREDKKRAGLEHLSTVLAALGKVVDVIRY